jgi:hypothetical protein
VEHDFAEVETDHFDVLGLDELSELIGAFLSDQLHPEE